MARVSDHCTRSARRASGRGRATVKESYSALDRVPSRASGSFEADASVLPVTFIEFITWLNNPDTGHGGAQVATERLRGAGPIAALLFTPAAPDLVEPGNLDNAAGRDNAVGAKKRTDRAAEVFQVLYGFSSRLRLL